MVDPKSYKVQTLKVKDFKNIENLEIDFNGKSVFLIGENAQNKSSIIQAIWLALSRIKAPTQPVHEGKDEASIMVVIGNDSKQYTVERIFKQDGAETLEITSPDGFKTSKVANLQTLVGDIGFDIMKFVQLCATIPGRREQVKMIRAFLPEDANKSIDLMDEEVKGIKDERTEINKSIAKLKAVIKPDAFSEGDLEKYANPVSVTKLMEEYKAGQEFNSKLEAALNLKAEHEKKIVELKESVKNVSESAVKAIEELDKEYAAKVLKIKTDSEKAIDEAAQAGTKLENSVKAIEEETKDVQIKPIATIQEQINDSEAHNSKHKEIIDHNANVKELERQTHLYITRGQSMEEIAQKRQDLIVKCSLPVEHLTFNDDHLLYRGLPLEEETQCTSELMEIGMKLAIAKNPACKIVRIDRAESLGADRLARMKELGKEAGFQMFYEEVKRGQEELKIEFIEE